MKIAIIGREGQVFPQCEDIAQIAIVRVDPEINNVQQTEFVTPPPSKEEVIDWLGQQAVEVLLTSGISRQNRARLEQKGIQVIVGVPPFRFEPVIARFLTGTLQTGNNACEQHETSNKGKPRDPTCNV